MGRLPSQAATQLCGAPPRSPSHPIPGGCPQPDPPCIGDSLRMSAVVLSWWCHLMPALVEEGKVRIVALNQICQIGCSKREEYCFRCPLRCVHAKARTRQPGTACTRPAEPPESKSSRQVTPLEVDTSPKYQLCSRATGSSLPHRYSWNILPLWVIPPKCMACVPDGRICMCGDMKGVL